MADEKQAAPLVKNHPLLLIFAFLSKANKRLNGGRGECREDFAFVKNRCSSITEKEIIEMLVNVKYLIRGLLKNHL